MVKFHLKTLLEDKTLGFKETEHISFEKDLSETIKELNSKLKFESFEKIDPRLLSKIRNDIEYKVGPSFNIENLGMKDLRDLVSVLSYEDVNIKNAYCRDDLKVKKIVDIISVKQSISLAKRLWKNQLYFNQLYSEKSRARINELCLRIFSKDQNDKNTSQRLMKIHNEFKIFSDECFKLVAQKMLNEKDPEVLDRLYMTLFDFQTSFGERVVVEMMKLLRSYLNNVNVQRAQHITNVLTDENGAFIVSSKLHEFCTSLLLVFKERSVAEEVSDILSLFIEKNLGDPRISTKWVHIPVEAKNIYLKWKVAASTELFFKIITESLATESDEYKNRWKKRERFWRKYLESDFITSAWLVLCSQGENFYKKFGNKEDKVPYGKINGSNNMLMLFIGDLKIVEFAPTGKVSIWKDSDSNTPKSYQMYYEEGDIRDSYRHNKLLVESHDSGGGWMQKVEKVIYKETHVRLKK